jgi:hypothetical protein
MFITQAEEGLAMVLSTASWREAAVGVGGNPSKGEHGITVSPAERTERDVGFCNI